MKTFNKAEFIRAIQQAKSIHALTQLTDTQHYVSVDKNFLLADLAEFDDHAEFNCQIVSGGENLFIG